MKKFRLKVNGKEYEVELEEIDENTENNLLQKIKEKIATPLPDINEKLEKSKDQKSLKHSKTTNLTEVTSPMPGNILSVKVKIGQQINEGDVVCILEAMKMENEICAPKSGIIAEIYITENKAVSAGDALVVIS